MARLKTRSSGRSSVPRAGLGEVQLGMSGLKRSYGYIYEELLPQLHGRKAINVYQEMSQNSAVIGAMLFAIDMFMRRVAWRVEAADQTPKHQKRANFLSSAKDDMEHTWADFIAEINTMLVFGWSWFEIVYKQRFNDTDEFGMAQSKFNDGMVGWQKFMPISQESWWRWDFDPQTGKTIGMWQRPAPDYSERYLPLGKSLHFRTTSRKDNPEGVSILRTAYRAWYFLKRIEEIEAIGVERDLAGIPIATVPAEMLSASATPSDKAMVQSIIKLVQNVRRDEQEGIVWPQAYDQAGNELYTFKLLTSGGTRQFPTDTIINRYESRIAMTALADFLLLGNESGNGSYALSTSKASMFQSALETWLNVIENVVNEHAVPLLFRMNGINEGPYPKFRHDIVQKPSLPDLATFISAMAGAGAQLFPDTGLENHLREFAELPIREENRANEANEEKVIGQQIETMLAESEAAQEIAERTGKDAQAEGIIAPPFGSIKQQAGMVSAAGGAQAATAGPSAASPTGPGGRKPGGPNKAPTKATGPVKSKLPPQKRRSTIAVRASQNNPAKTTGGNQRSVVGKARNQNAIREMVRRQLAPDFPDSAMSWIDDAEWVGPIRVPLGDINFKNQKRWAAHHEPGKVQKFKKKIMAGKEKPIVAFDYGNMGPGSIEIADGHHHGDAYQELGMNPLAFVARVPSKKGPWDEMHSYQRISDNPDSGGYEPGDRGGAVKKIRITVRNPRQEPAGETLSRILKSPTLTKALVDYRDAKDPERRCGTCSMFSISGDDESGWCSLVKGSIDPSGVCNRYTNIGGPRSDAEAARATGGLHDDVTEVREDMGLPRIYKKKLKLVGAGGVAVKAADTGRVLMLQRGLDHDDPASGKWEFPGGRRESVHESPENAGIREWQEETGLRLPKGEFTGHWVTPDNVYHGLVLTIPREDVLPINGGRDQVTNPDDPDGDQVESLAWWDPKHLDDHPALRKELRKDLDLVHSALKSSRLRKNIVLENTSKPQKRCDYCQRPATKIFVRPGAGAVVARCCERHVPQGKAEIRWAAENQVSPVNPSPYEPFPRVITQ